MISFNHTIKDVKLLSAVNKLRLFLLEPYQGRSHKHKAYSEKLNAEVYARPSSLLKGHTVSFISLINPQKYFLEKYGRGDLMPIDDWKGTMKRQKYFSKKYNAEVWVTPDSIIQEGWLSIKNVVDPQQYFLDNFSKSDLTPIDPWQGVSRKQKYFSKEWNAEVWITPDSIMSGGHWIKFQSLVDPQEYFLKNYGRGDLSPREKWKGTNNKQIYFSKEWNTEVYITPSSIMSCGHWLSFTSLVNPQQYFLENYGRGDLTPIDPWKKSTSKQKYFSKEWNAPVWVTPSKIINGSWISFISLVDPQQYFLDNYGRNDLTPLEKWKGTMKRQKYFSNSYKAEVFITPDKMIQGGWISYASLVDPQQHFIDNYGRGDLTLIDPWTRVDRKQRYFSKEWNAEVWVKPSQVMNNRWISFISLVDPQKYFVDNFCKGELTPIEKWKGATKKQLYFSKELNCEVTIIPENIMQGKWLFQGWFHSQAKKTPNRKAILYFVIVTSYLTGEVLLKVGVTSKNSKKRFMSKRDNGVYRIIPLYEFEGRMIDVSLAEQAILKKYHMFGKQHKTVTKLPFIGGSEIVKDVVFKEFDPSKYDLKEKLKPLFIAIES